MAAIVAGTRVMTPDPERTAPGFFDVRMRGFQHRTEIADLIALIDRMVTSLPAEHVDVRDAAGRVLAEDVVSQQAVPPFDRAAMDGYALRAEDTFGATQYNPLTLA